uniref:Uncharacterized protein n=1 Tax=Aromatoleum anaerobium TaxID=182180 RepID=A0ABX1PKA6_9RHOO
MHDHASWGKSAFGAAFGYDAEDVDREIVADNAPADRLGLVFDSDPRHDKGAWGDQLGFDAGAFCPSACTPRRRSGASCDGC